MMDTNMDVAGNIKSEKEQGRKQPADFKTIWQEYYPKLLLFVKPFFPGIPDREDAVQEILLKVFQSMSRYDSRYSMSTWIYRIGRNYCIDCSRQKARRAKLHREYPVQYEAEDNNFNPEQVMLNAEVKAKIRELIAGLEETDQQLCYLYNYADLSYPEINQVMQIPVGTIKYRMHNIRIKIKAEMEAYYAGSYT